MTEKYKFTQEQYYEAERAAVRQLLDTVSCAKGKPTAIFVAAQPGAGKTGLAKKCMIDFIMGRNQEIVAKHYTEEHPSQELFPIFVHSPAIFPPVW